MKKTFAAVCMIVLVCFVAGCLREEAAIISTDLSNAAERVTELRSEYTIETTSEAETTGAAETTAAPETTTVPETTAVPETTTAVSAESTVPVPLTETSASVVPSAVALPGAVPELVAVSAAKQPQTTRPALFGKWRKILDQNETSKPDPAFFDDVVFVGDSVTQGLRNYTTSQRNKGKACLGSAQFLCYGSMSYTNALSKVSSGSMHPVYKGQKVKVEDGVQKCGAKKVFIMLGMNDFSGYSEKTWKKNVCTLLDRICESNPDASIYLQSVTPILSGKEHGRFTNANIQIFNEYIQQVCSDRGYTYVDIYHVLADESGHLKKSYCGDPGAMGIHMSANGCAAWVKYLQETFCGA